MYIIKWVVTTSNNWIDVPVCFKAPQCSYSWTRDFMRFYVTLMKSIIDCIYWRLKNTIKSEKQHPRVGRHFKTGQEGINWKLEFKTNQFHSDMWAKIHSYLWFWNRVITAQSQRSQLRGQHSQFLRCFKCLVFMQF